MRTSADIEGGADVGDKDIEDSADSDRVCDRRRGFCRVAALAVVGLNFFPLGCGRFFRPFRFYYDPHDPDSPEVKSVQRYALSMLDDVFPSEDMEDLASREGRPLFRSHPLFVLGRRPKLMDQDFLRLIVASLKSYFEENNITLKSYRIRRSGDDGSGFRVFCLVECEGGYGARIYEANFMHFLKGTYVFGDLLCARAVHDPHFAWEATVKLLLEGNMVRMELKFSLI